jgi:hypothetical protein
VTNVLYLRPRNEFDEHELHELGVAFENCCSAIPETRSAEFRIALAKTLILWAMAGRVDGTALYLRALQQYGWQQSA